MKKLILFFILFCAFHFTIFGQSSKGYYITSYHSDTVYLNQNLYFEVASALRGNGSKPPFFCSPLTVITDSIKNSQIIVDLTFNIAGPSSFSYKCYDTINVKAIPIGSYQVICYWNFVDSFAYPNQAPPSYIRFASDTIQVVVLSTTGIEEYYRVNPFTVFPNPAKGVVQFLNLPEGIEQIKFFNSSGQLVKQIVGNQNRMEISELKNGIYFVQIIARNSSSIEKLVIAR